MGLSLRDIGRGIAAYYTGGMSEVGGDNSAGEAISRGEYEDAAKMLAVSSYGTGTVGGYGTGTVSSYGTGVIGGLNQFIGDIPVANIDPNSAAGLIQQQTSANQGTALYNAVLNRVNQQGPFGSTQWTRTPSERTFDPRLQKEVDYYWAHSQPGTSQSWAGGTLTRNDDGTATYRTGEGEGMRTAIIRRGADFDMIAAADPLIKQQLQTEFGYVDPTTHAARFASGADPGKWSVAQTLSPELQAAWNQQIGNTTAAQKSLADMNVAMQGRDPGAYLQQVMQAYSPMLGDGSQAIVHPGMAQAAQINRSGLYQPQAARVQGGAIGDRSAALGQMGYGTSMPSMPQASEATRQQVINAMLAQQTRTLDPMWQQREQGLEAKLAAQGLTQGSQAWQAETDAFNRGRTDAYQNAMNEAILRGGQEQSRLFEMGLQGRQLAGQEALSRAQLGQTGDIANAGFATQAAIASGNNEMQAQLARAQADAAAAGTNAQLQTNVNTQNAGQQTQARLANASNFLQALNQIPGAARGLQDLDSQQFNQRMAVIQAMMGNLPNSTGTEAQVPLGNMAAADVAGITGQIWQQQNIAQQNAIADRNAKMALIGQLAGVAGMAMMSDRRTKLQIRPAFTDARGRQWYSYRYRWSPQRHFGVMADEVAQTDPEAVITLRSGYQMVDYSKLN